MRSVAGRRDQTTVMREANKSWVGVLVWTDGRGFLPAWDVRKNEGITLSVRGKMHEPTTYKEKRRKGNRGFQCMWRKWGNESAYCQWKRKEWMHIPTKSLWLGWVEATRYCGISYRRALNLARNTLVGSGPSPSTFTPIAAWIGWQHSAYVFLDSHEHSESPLGTTTSATFSLGLPKPAIHWRCDWYGMKWCQWWVYFWKKRGEGENNRPSWNGDGRRRCHWSISTKMKRLRPMLPKGRWNTSWWVLNE